MFESLSLNGRSIKAVSLGGRQIWHKQDQSWTGLKFKAVTAGSTLQLLRQGSNAPNPSLLYSTDGGRSWATFSVGLKNGTAGTKWTALNAGDEICLKADGTNDTFANNSSTAAYTTQFLMTGKIEASGNIMSLLDGDNYETMTEIPTAFCFARLFNASTALVTAPELPATVISSSCYRYTFYNCTALTAAPELPATTLGTYCYSNMFQGCTALVTAPSELPATTLASYCCASMFRGCTSLTAAPRLPAETLDVNCCQSMFYGCTALTAAPDLPAKDLADHCYQTMFYGCSSLTSAPRLPAETLVSYCYYQMYQGCTSLTEASLAATTMTTYSCTQMYQGCSSLSKIRLAYTGAWNNNFSSNWVDGVAASGDMEYDGDDVRYFAYAIPTGWTLNGRTKDSWTGLRMYDSVSGSNVKLTSQGTPPSVQLQYSLNYGHTWHDYVLDQTITLGGGGVCFKATTTNTGFASYDTNNFHYFAIAGSAGASGNIMSLLDGESYESMTEIPSNYCFARLFQSCTSLTEAPELPATTLKPYCYAYMFHRCFALTSAPELPAETLVSYCYKGMYMYAGLTAAPELPATTLATECYKTMFAYCTALTSAPDLPATTLFSYCYSQMFSGCSSLTSAPSELPALTLANYCYEQMFYGCTSLTAAPDLPATVLKTSCYEYMFYSCNALAYIKIGYTGGFSTMYFYYWVAKVAAEGDLYYNGSSTSHGDSAIPTGWTVHTY